MAHDARSGLLTLPSAAGIVPSYQDAVQWIKAAAAARRAIVDLLGGEGIVSGGATAVGDLADGGATYPAVKAFVLDDAGEAWYCSLPSGLAMTFTATSGSGCKAYLYPAQLVGVSPAAATGGITNWVIEVLASGTAAPAHSLLLGAGDVTASAFTTWTEDAGARVALNAGPVARTGGTQVTLGNSNGEIGGLSIGAAYDQAEHVALRDKTEELADDVRAIHAALRALGIL